MTAESPAQKKGRSPAGRRWFVGLAPKLLAATVAVILGVSFAMSTRATSQLTEKLTAGFESKGEAIALALASAAEQGGGTDFSVVQGSVDANKIISGVRYIFVTDSHNRPTVHTFSPAFPNGLELRNTVGLGADLRGRRVKVAHEIEVPGPTGVGRAIDIAAPIGGGALGTVHVGMDEDVIDESASTLQKDMLVWGGGVALVGVLLSLLVTALVVIRPIRELTRVTGDIVSKGDLTQHIAIRSDDEIGDLAATFTEMVVRLREIPTEIAESTKLLAESVRQLSMSAAEQGETVNTQASALHETQVTAQEIKETSLLAAQKTEVAIKYADRADTVSKTGELAVEQSLKALTEIRARVLEIAERITALGERTLQVGNVTQTVKDLADQSNMLALNAAIEAVRSGEHGRGFAVVAREIRSLADQSVDATKRVREILEDISSAIRTAVSITEKGAQGIDSGLAQVKTSGEKLTELSGIVKDNSAAMRQINAAVGQQNAGIAQIFRAVTDQNNMMGDTVKRLEATDQSIKTLSEVSARLVQIVARFHV